MPTKGDRAWTARGGEDRVLRTLASPIGQRMTTRVTRFCRPSVARWSDHTERFALLVARQHYSTVSMLAEPVLTHAVWLAAVQTNAERLSGIPLSIISVEIRMAAVIQKRSAITMIPESERTPDMLRAALEGAKSWCECRPCARAFGEVCDDLAAIDREQAAAKDK